MAHETQQTTVAMRVVASSVKQRAAFLHAQSVRICKTKYEYLVSVNAVMDLPVSEQWLNQEFTESRKGQTYGKELCDQTLLALDSCSSLTSCHSRGLKFFVQSFTVRCT